MLLLTAATCLLARGVVGCGRDEPARPVVVAFVASSAAPVMEAIARRFEEREGVAVEVQSGSSATLAKQAMSGATMHLFLSADRRWMDELVKAGLVDDADVSDVLSNGLVMATAAGRQFDPSKPDALKGVRRFAIGDPASVPVGRYAKQALEQVGWWSIVEPVTVTLPDARAVVKLLESGEAEAGVVYASDVKGNPAIQAVAYFPVSAVYVVGAAKTIDPVTRRLMAFLREADARAAFDAAGFGVLPEVTAK